MEVIERSSMKPKIDVKNAFADALDDRADNAAQPRPGLVQPTAGLTEVDDSNASEEFTRLLRGNEMFRW